MRDVEQRSGMGTIVDANTVRFERLLPGPIERVWAFLTESEKRGKWFASGELELRVGGKVTLFFRHADLSPYNETPPDKYKQFANGVESTGLIMACEPPRLLSFIWGDKPDDSVVTFELTPRGNDVLLVLTHRRLRDRDEMINVAGGWHSHLSVLADHLYGRTPQHFWPMVTKWEAEYGRRFAQ